MSFANTRPRPPASDDGMIPLINIVFLLLIFFMVAGSIATSDAVMVIPPVSKAESQIEPEQTTIIIGPKQALYLGNQPISPEALIANLTQQQFLLLGDASTSEGVMSQGLSVLVKADGHLAMGELQTVLSHIKSAGIARISLATSPQNDVIAPSPPKEGP